MLVMNLTTGHVYLGAIRTTAATCRWRHDGLYPADADHVFAGAFSMMFVMIPALRLATRVNAVLDSRQLKTQDNLLLSTWPGRVEFRDVTLLPGAERPALSRIPLPPNRAKL